MGDDPILTSVDINYLKTPQFREIPCDGTFGGSTPSGKLWVAFYSERYPMPRIVRHTVKKIDGETVTIEPDGEVIDGRRGLVRNVEFGVYLTIEAAQNLREWLGEQLENLKDEE